MFSGIEARVLEHLRSGVLVTDATEPEFPIVYLNPAFTTLTGYEFEEVAGRNCRFLQGKDTDQPGLGLIRKKLKKSERVHTVLKNYRKNGELFLNEMYLDPIFDDEGNLTHYVGCQNECNDAASLEIVNTGSMRLKRLTIREKEVFELVASGHSNKSIARLLSISPRTAEKQRQSVFSKFEVNNLALLLRYAIALSIRLEMPEE